LYICHQIFPSIGILSLLSVIRQLVGVRVELNIVHIYKKSSGELAKKHERSKLLSIQKPMARLPRLSPVHVPIHVIQRGNNRQVCFVAEEDYGHILAGLHNTQRNIGVEVHAWVLMSNHVHYYK